MALAAQTIHDAPPSISEAEWRLRVELAAAYRLVDHFGWCALIYAHLTARVPGPDDHFLINPYGLNYDEITASNLVKIDVNGEVVEPTEYPVNEAGFIIHSAIHMDHAEDNQVVMHTHSRAGMAVAALEDGLLPISMDATLFHGDLAYHDYEGPSLYPDERDRLVASLSGKRAMILRNHGLLTTGKTVAECFVRLYRLEMACQVQIDAAGAGKLNILGENLAAKSGADVRRFTESGGQPGSGQEEPGFGQLEFAALMRKMDKVDPGYRA